MLPFQVPAQIQAPAGAPVPLAAALAKLLDEYDLKGDGRPLTPVQVAPAERPSYRWLLETLTRDLPENPFPKGSPAHAEAESLRSLMQGGTEVLGNRLANQGLAETGTQLGFWRWGRRQVRAGRLAGTARRAWEDALLSVQVPTLATSYALRHALSFALAEGDLVRFTALKAAHAADASDLLLDYQRLFGLIGSPGPKLHLWALPDLKPMEIHLKDLGKERVWITPVDPDNLALPPAGVAWIIPSRTGELAEAAPSLDDASRREAEALVRKGCAGAWFAPSRADFEAYGLTVFPVLILTDFRGFITAIRMGEAAPPQP
jgi:hypothetical protein